MANCPGFSVLVIFRVTRGEAGAKVKTWPRRLMMIPATVAELGEAMAGKDYVLSDGLAVSLFLALRKQRPLFLEGEAGVGKTEVAKTLATLLDRRLIRLQCYEGLDINAAAYEWNYARQMMQIQIEKFKKH